MEQLAALATHVRTELAKVLIGQREVVDQLLVVAGVRGTRGGGRSAGAAKTLAVKSLARICGIGFQRVQCTADLMPADITGTNVFNLATSSFTAASRSGVHRPAAGGRDQSHSAANAGGTAGGDGRTTGDDRWRRLSAARELHTVLATQNPVESRARIRCRRHRLDRFLLKIRIGYPTVGGGSEILSRYDQGFDPRHLESLGIAPLPPELLAGRAQGSGERASGTVAAVVYGENRAADARLAAVSLGASPRRRWRCLLSRGRWPEWTVATTYCRTM